MAGPTLLEGWLRLAAERVHAHADELTRLDQAIGDGDHGINLDRGFAAVVAAIGAADVAASAVQARAHVAEQLRQAGRALISNVGGASGPLYGTGLLRAGGAIDSADAGTTDADLLVLALEAAAAGIAALGRSTTGEKTMLDALVPAATVARSTLDGGSHDVAAIAGVAAQAAEAGAEATIPLRATKGRASYLGERSIGHKDPGAASSALLLRALADALAR